MQKFTKTTRTLAALLVSGTALTGVASAAEITGNVGATTDYIWRGNVQGSGGASLSGGIDIDFGNGLAAGTWVGTLGDSDTSANYEQDLYVSYSTEIAGYPLEVGYISYMYPGVADSADDFEDFYVSTSVAGIGISYYMLVSAESATMDADEGTYLSVDYDYELDDGWTMSLHYGMESFDNSEDDEDTSISLSKGDMTFTVSGDEGDDTRAIVSWGASF
ncbi:TorF family putative porin [Alphaproteobacteria bacterium]|nr:TorF family putative porin [Alphaproteobacteria bacterium]MDB2431333.1 TorF family putative porin [Alphaproteobacteria bacterium]